MRGEQRPLKILKHIVDIFIETGEPASSLAVCERFKKRISSATIRNEMAKLERDGFLEQPHTSAGRRPTKKGFRIYINSLMESESLPKEEKIYINQCLEKDLSSISAVVENASLALAEFTKLLVVSTSNVPRFFVVCKVDAIKTGKKTCAVFIVASSGEIKNKICKLKFEITDEELNLFKKIVNENLVGNTVDVLNQELMDKLALAFGCYFYSLLPLLNALYDISNEILKKQINFKGEENLLQNEGFKTSELLEFLHSKNKIEKILSSAFSGINILFGKEDDVFVLENSSLIVSKFGLKEPLGSFGVVGPIRINYEKILPYVSYFSKKISKLVEKLDKEIKGGEGLWKNNQKTIKNKTTKNLKKN